MEASRRSSRPLVVFKGTHTCASCWRGPSLNPISPIERLGAVGRTAAVERPAMSKQRKHRTPPGEDFASLMPQCQECWALLATIIGTLPVYFLKRKSHLGMGKLQVFARALKTEIPDIQCKITLPYCGNCFKFVKKKKRERERKVNCLIGDDMKSYHILSILNTYF